MANQYVNKVELADGTPLLDISSDTVTAGSMLNGVTAHGANGAIITGSIATKTGSNLSASGKTVTVPAGYYASQYTKDVAAGSAATPDTTVTANPSISVNSSGLITATASATKSVTPTVSAGYVSSGTAGTITVSGSNTSQLTTQAAQTITPGTTDQTIASGKYLTGAQTIKGDANLVAENIAEGVTIFGVQGTHSGGSTEVDSKDVDFYDYDGTRVYSYTAQEFAALTAMPANPSHDGLTAQGWNWTLADAKTYVAANGMLDIGQMYVTNDGKTRLKISIDALPHKNITLYIKQSASNGVSIDWGDNSAQETISGTGIVNKSHEYSQLGDYTICLNVTSGTIELGYNSSSYSVIMPRICLKAVEIGSATITQSAFANCAALEYITIPQSVTTIPQAFAYYCHSLKTIIIPTGVTSINLNNVFSYNYSLRSISLPKEVTGSTYTGIFYSCVNLKRVALPPNITTIGNNFCRACSSITKIVIPSNVETIGNYFMAETGIGEVHMKRTSPPSIGTSPFYNDNNYTIYVPSESLSTYQGASNWSNKSSYMVGE